MKKTMSLKVLAVIAAVLTGILIIGDIYIAFAPMTWIELTGGIGTPMEVTELPTLTRSLLMMEALGVLPLTVLYLFNAFTDKAGMVKGVVTVILIGAFSLLRAGAAAFFYGKALNSAVGEGEQVAVLLVNANTGMRAVASLSFLAAMLMCCAAGAEIYIARHNEDP